MKKPRPKFKLWCVVLTIKGIPAYVDGFYMSKADAQSIKKTEIEDMAAYPEVDHTGWKFTVVEMVRLTNLAILRREGRA